MKTIEEKFKAMKPVAGFRLGCAAAGIKRPGRDDLLVMEACEGSSVAAVFTRNAFCAAPVQVSKQHLKKGQVRYMVVNSGNANAGTGEGGLDDALRCCDAVATITDTRDDMVMPFSTGVIGERLPVNKIMQALPVAVKNLAEDNWHAAAKAIMTTDTVPKGVTVSRDISGQRVTVTGMVKGAGMICPDMATLLAYVATDAAVDGKVLQECLESVVNKSFNSITVDGDTSTNDSCVLVATGKSGLPLIDSTRGESYRLLYGMVLEVCEFLAAAVIRDGEGATKFVEVNVNGGTSEQECRDVAFTIAHSPLVKTALFASDPNWGRILAAVGRAGVESLVIEDVHIYLNDVCIVSHGARDKNYREELGVRAMAGSDIEIRVELNRGNESARVWTCDFSYDYVKINAEYRT